MRNIFFQILLAITVLGCTEKSELLEPTAKLKLDVQAKIKQEAPKIIILRGTVRYKKIEGGFWALEGEDGNKYLPSGLSKALLIDGMFIEVTGIVEENADIMTFQQYGKILKVQKSKMIDNKNARALNSY